MKKILTIIAILFSVATQARTLTLNNSNPSPGQYTTWSAIAAVVTNGDTVLIQGSLRSYYSITVNKRLVIIGPGHNPTDKQNAQKAYADQILFYTGSNGSKVYGLETSNLQAIDGNIDSVEVHLCKINDAFYNQGGNIRYWVFDGNVFASGGPNVRAQARSIGEFIFRNNIFNGTINDFYGTYIGYNYFTNNIFLANTANTIQNVYYGMFTDNIFYRAGFANYGNTGLSFNKNCSYQCQGGNSFPNGTNYENVDPKFVTDISTGAYFDYNIDYHLQESSPLLTAATDGTQLGVYGGVGDFDQNGVPHNPYIKTFNITGPTTVNAGDSIQVYIKAKVRN